MKDWHGTNSELFFVVRRSRKWLWRKRWSSPRMIGYFAVLPLTDAAAGEVRAEKLIGTAFSSQHLTASTRASVCYVGGVAASSSKGKVMDFLKRELVDILESGVSTILTRPVTPSGLRLVKGYGFKPVAAGIGHEMDRVHELALPGLPPPGDLSRRRTIVARLARLRREARNHE
jgi:hypothetical protein